MALSTEGFNLDLINGNNICRIKFRSRSTSKLELSILNLIFFRSRYFRISAFGKTRIGRMILSLFTGMPEIPFRPVPLIKLRRTVSALSSQLCAVAILLKLIFFNNLLSSEYLSTLPASSIEIFFLWANCLTFFLTEYIGIFNDEHNCLQKSSSREDRKSVV